MATPSIYGCILLDCKCTTAGYANQMSCCFFLFLFWHVVSHKDLMDGSCDHCQAMENGKLWTTKAELQKGQFHILCFVQTNPSPGMETNYLRWLQRLIYEDVHLPFSWTEARPDLIKTRGLTVWSKRKSRWLFGLNGLFSCTRFTCDLVRSRANRAALAYASQNLALIPTVPLRKSKILGSATVPHL